MLPDASAQNYSIFKPVIFDNGVNPFLMTKQRKILLLHSLFTLRELRVFRNSACAVALVDTAGLANDPHGLAEDAKTHWKAGSWPSGTETSKGRDEASTPACSQPCNRAIDFAARRNLKSTSYQLQEEFNNSQTAQCRSCRLKERERQPSSGGESGADTLSKRWHLCFCPPVWA